MEKMEKALKINSWREEMEKEKEVFLRGVSTEVACELALGTIKGSGNWNALGSGRVLRSRKEEVGTHNPAHSRNIVTSSKTRTC